MRVLIDIGHPAHVHIFKNLAWKLQDNGHNVLFTCKDREHVMHLLKRYGFVYNNFGRHYKTMRGKLCGITKNEIQMFNTALNFKPDLFVSAGSLLAAHASFLVRKPHIALEDTFNMEQVRLCMPFTDVVLTGDYPHPSLGKKEIQYPGYHELAYLHPNVFTRDESVLDSLGVEKGEKYAIVRFVAWAATHDVGHAGMSLDNKTKLVSELAKNMKVFISSEAELPNEFKDYLINIRPDEMHSALAFAHLLVGESSTMASEAAVLGTPAIFMNKKSFGCTDDQIKYGILYQFSDAEDDQSRLISKATELASKADKSMYEHNAKLMLQDKIDLSGFLYWFITNYPHSKQEMMSEDGFDFSRFK